MSSGVRLTIVISHVLFTGEPSTLCIYFVITVIITFLYISESINVFIYLVTYRPIGPGAFCVFAYVIVYNYVNVCTSHNNKPFTITTTTRVNVTALPTHMQVSLRYETVIVDNWYL